VTSPRKIGPGEIGPREIGPREIGPKEIGPIGVVRSSAVRFGAVYAAAAGFVLLAFAATIWLQSSGRLKAELAATAAEDSNSIALHLQAHGLQAAVELIRQRIASGAEHKVLIELADPNWRVLAGSLPDWPAEFGRELGWHDVDIAETGEYRVIVSDLPDGLHLVTGRELSAIFHIRRLFFLGLAAAVCALLLLALGGAVFIRRAILARADALNRTTSAIVRGDLRQRLPRGGERDELDLLAETINGMLDQIEQLVQSVRNASNAIAHDLRTPMAELRARLEELARRRPAPAEAFAEIDAAIDDIDRVIDIFNAILRLAEIDAGVRRSGFAPVELAAIVDEMVELYGPVAEERRIAMTSDVNAHPVIAGDRSLIAQAVGNLIDNALKYTPPGGAVTVQVPATSEAAVAVADNGPGIPESERGDVTKRFYRGDASRGTPGTGLGLSLVAAVAKLHGGTLDLTDNAPGLKATLTFPASDPAAAG
jgi:signal transduction histidine kinase